MTGWEDSTGCMKTLKREDLDTAQCGGRQRGLEREVQEAKDFGRSQMRHHFVINHFKACDFTLRMVGAIKM